MLGEGLRAGLGYMGIETRTLVHVEREAHAAAVLVARIQEGSLDDAAIWSDVCTFDAAAWRGRVDCVVAGFPCQDLSVAGRRAGLNGKRSGLFFEVVRIATDCGAWFMFLENVAGIATATASVVDAEEGELDERAAARVVGELADLGWDAEWITISASDVGASHGRARWFCLAWRVDYAARHGGSRSGDGQGRSGRGVREAGLAMDDAERPEWRALRVGGTGQEQGHVIGRREADGWSGIADSALGDASCERRREGWPELSGRQGRPDPSGSISAVAYAYGAGQQEHLQRDRRPIKSEQQAPQRNDPNGRDPAGIVADSSSPRLARGGASSDAPGWQEPHGHAGLASRGLFAPGPADKAWRGILERTPWLAPALSIEQQHDAAEAFAATLASAEPVLRGVADGLACGLDFDHRAQRLKCGGNGVVALCAATAFVLLGRRAGLFGLTPKTQPRHDRERNK